MYPNLKNKHNILFYLILLTFINSISSSSISDKDEHSLSSSSSSTRDLSSTNRNKEDSDEVLPKQLFAHYRESYITKEDAKTFRQRIQSHKKPYTDHDYDDLIHEMDFKPRKHKKMAADMFDKKYFDYLPAEDDSDGENSNTHKKSPPKKHSKHHQNSKNNKRRYRRDTLDLDDKEITVGAEKDVAKRQIYTHQGYYYPAPVQRWNEQYYQNHRPYVNQHYLPSAVYYVPSLKPYNEYPANVPHHNVPHPPVNPPTNTQIVTAMPNLGNRGDFDDEDDRPVWEMWDYNSPNLITIVNQPSKPLPTRRPAPSILRTTTQSANTLPPRRPAPPIVRNPNKAIEDSKITGNTLNSVQSSGSNRGPELVFSN